MELYLVQHGTATSKEENPARPLTTRGREDVARVARAARSVGVTVSAIYHSGKLRAEQTAEILATELGVGALPEKLDGLSPNDDPGTVRDLLGRLLSGTLLVGHLPHLSRLCGLLAHGHADWECVAFRNGGLVALSEREDGSFVVRWALTPEVVPRAAR
jgi:phosphohistidine phosphatase